MGLDSVELVMAWEKEFGIVIPDDVAATLETPRLAIDSIFDSLLGTRVANTGRLWTRDDVRNVLRRITSEQIGVSDFDDDDEFVRDLGID